MVDFKGQVSACCQFEASSTLENYQEMMQQYRLDMQQGIQIKPCRRCWEDESKGFPSLRQSAIEDFKRYDNHSGLMILDLRVTNNCNLACTMCNEHASSLWNKLKGSNSNYTLSKEVQDELIKNSNNLIKLSIQGGEPFYGNEFIDFVDRLPNKQNMQLEIFTNVITANIEVVERWIKEFQHVMIIASVDGTEEVFEDIRWPASWNKLERKIKALYEIKNFGLNFNFTLQNNNILNIKRFIDWRNTTVINCPITISILEWPNYYHFSNLTVEEKNQALALLDTIKAYPEEIRILNTVKKHLLESNENELLLQARYKALENTKLMREQYMVRPERLELSSD